MTGVDVTTRQPHPDLAGLVPPQVVTAPDALPVVTSSDIPLQVVVGPDAGAGQSPAGTRGRTVPAVTRQAGAYAFQLTAEGEVLWRVLGGNHRELGRAASPAPDVEAALLDIARLWQVAADRPGCASERVLLRQPRGWVWRLRVEGVDVAAARHPYDRRSRCHESASAFLSVVRALGVPAAPRVLDHRVRRAR